MIEFISNAADINLPDGLRDLDVFFSDAQFN